MRLNRFMHLLIRWRRYGELRKHMQGGFPWIKLAGFPWDNLLHGWITICHLICIIAIHTRMMLMIMLVLVLVICQ